MNKTIYRFQFESSVPMDEAEISLAMAIIAAEALYGQPAVRLALRYLFGEEKRACVIEGDSEIAREVVLIFTQFLIREFGENSFQVTQPVRERAATPAAPAAPAPAPAGSEGKAVAP